MPELSEKEYERLRGERVALLDERSRLLTRTDLLMERAQNLLADLRLAHQNDPAHYHETIQTTPRCMFCGHERETEAELREAWGR